jgi:NAD(P)-dependent dehydrogenase (short-subunit alcohol dehydrogenase family)
MIEKKALQNGRLNGKVSVITGGSTGMGRATALAFAAEGAKVSIFDIQDNEGQKTVEMIRDGGGQAAFFHADVTKDAEINAAFDASIETFGAYNILFNHAGSIIVKPMHETSEEEYDWLMDVNVKSAFFNLSSGSKRYELDWWWLNCNHFFYCSRVRLRTGISILYVKRCCSAASANYRNRIS